MIPTGAYKRSIASFLAPVADLMADPTVSEIMINGPNEIWVERSGQLCRTDCAFSCPEALYAALKNIAQFAGRYLGDDLPILEAYLPDGSRIEAVLAPIAENGPVVAIRRFSKSTLTVERLVAVGSLTLQAANWLSNAVEQKLSIVVSGGTGSGKTSLLGALSSFVGDNERIVVIEDTREVQLQKSHVIYLETRSADEQGRGRVTTRDLLRATLRLRPDRIVVGEVRGAEALDLIQAMTSGHGGSMTTAHASSPQGALRRIETMALMDDTDLPLSALRAQVAAAVDLVVQVCRDRSGRRRVCEIASVQGLSEGGTYLTQRVFLTTTDGQLTQADTGDS
ncbi:MAG: ATPase, T2SS/T4P/T4SS family [Myxococcota bacterium]|nr:ATPase, T2SS/T4P/T4SS family [Myxococcota bacterium]